MERWRRKVLVEGVSKRQVCREYALGWRTLEKLLGFPEPPGYRRQVPRRRPRLGPFVGLIGRILAADADPSTPRKQRQTARRVYERLRDEHGYAGSEVTVRRYVAEQGRVRGEVFIPLNQPAGEAQFDFGEATVEIAGVRVKAALAVMTLPYSDALFVSAYPRECTETFQAGPWGAETRSGGELVFVDEARGVQKLGHAASRYSWMIPPGRSSRWMAVRGSGGSPRAGATAVRSGGWRSSARCGLTQL